MESALHHAGGAYYQTDNPARGWILTLPQSP